MWGCLSYKLYRFFQTQHSLRVTIFTLGFRLFFILLQINLTWRKEEERGVGRRRRRRGGGEERRRERQEEEERERRRREERERVGWRVKIDVLLSFLIVLYYLHIQDGVNSTRGSSLSLSLSRERWGLFVVSKCWTVTVLVKGCWFQLQFWTRGR